MCLPGTPIASGCDGQWIISWMPCSSPSLATLSVQAPPAPHRVLIQDVTIISPERKTPLQQGYVVLENDRIAAVGRGRRPRAAGIRSSPARGRVLIPGLIDGHTHLAVPAGLPLPVPPELQAIAAAYAEQLPRSYLYSGFTTVIDLVAFDRAFLDRFKAAPLHPDSYDCGGALALANGYPMAMVPKEVGWDDLPQLPLGSAPEGRHSRPVPARRITRPKATVARVAADGGICVKTFEERGFGPAKNLPTPTLAMIRDVVRESHARGLPVLMHANSLGGLAVRGPRRRWT